MSAYGSIERTHCVGPLRTRIWATAESPSVCLYTFHLTLSNARRYDGLVEYLHSVFAKEVDGGMTYPQEKMQDQASFENYFFAADVILALVASTAAAHVEDGLECDMDLNAVRAGKAWEDCVGGFYYVKPNYPGRSSHICNAGFVVPPAQRGKGYGTVLAKTYLEYGPRLGYQASVFNIVYANNEASIKLWDRLGFTRAGLIPRAGRLKRKNGDGEEYVDAIVFYKSFS